jgi:hypothetical protein
MKANNHDTDDRFIRTCCRGSVSISALPLHVLIQTSPAHKLSFDLQRKDRPKSRAARLQAYSRPPSSPIYQFLGCYIRGLKDSPADHHRERQRYYCASLCPCPLLPVHFRLRERISPETRLLYGSLIAHIIGDDVFARSRASGACCGWRLVCGMGCEVFVEGLSGPEDVSRSGRYHLNSHFGGMPETDSAVVWTATLMALGSFAGDGRDDGWEDSDDGASSWSVASFFHRQYW